MSLSAFADFVNNTSYKATGGPDEIMVGILLRTEQWDRWRRGLTTDMEELRRSHADEEPYVTQEGKFAWRKKSDGS